MPFTVRTRRLNLAAAAALGASAVASDALAHGALPPTLPPTSAYFGLGVEHILTGFDHLLLIAGLVVMHRRLAQAAWAVTAFGLAHSLTLALCALGLIAPDPRWVEPAIALSIAYLGVENLWLPVAGARMRLAALFGLLHGCGFGGALLEVGLPEEGSWLPLVLFNLGVEVGQLAVAALLFVALRRLAGMRGFERRALVTLNAGLIVAGSAFGIDRVLQAAETRRDQTTTAVADPDPSAASPSAPAPRAIFGAAPASLDPRVEELCAVWHELPRTRRAACAGRRAGIDLGGECRRVLGGSVASGSVALDSTELATCAERSRERYAGCEFTATPSLDALPSCRAVIEGTLAEGASCRSSLECRDGLHCDGVGPMDRGRCAPPKPDGRRCDLAIDPLSSYVQHAASEEHRECAGQCVRGRCVGAARAADKTAQANALDRPARTGS